MENIMYLITVYLILVTVFHVVVFNKDSLLFGWELVSSILIFFYSQQTVTLFAKRHELKNQLKCTVLKNFIHHLCLSDLIFQNSWCLYYMIINNKLLLFSVQNLQLSNIYLLLFCSIYNCEHLFLSLRMNKSKQRIGQTSEWLRENICCK